MIKIVLFRYGIVSNVTSAGHICIISNVISAIKKIVYITIVKKIPKITYYLKKVWPENNKPSIIPIPWIRYCVLFCAFYFLLLGLQEDKVEQWERTVGKTSTMDSKSSLEHAHHLAPEPSLVLQSKVTWAVTSTRESVTEKLMVETRWSGHVLCCLFLGILGMFMFNYGFVKHSKCFIRVLLQKQKCFVRQSNRRAPFYRP